MKGLANAKHRRPHSREVELAEIAMRHRPSEQTAALTISLIHPVLQEPSW